MLGVPGLTAAEPVETLESVLKSYIAGNVDQGRARGKRRERRGRWAWGAAETQAGGVVLVAWPDERWPQANPSVKRLAVHV